MKQSELIKLAKKIGVTVEEICGEWSAFVEIEHPHTMGVAVFTRKKLQSLVNVLAKNNIKIIN